MDMRTKATRYFNAKKNIGGEGGKATSTPGKFKKKFQKKFKTLNETEDAIDFDAQAQENGGADVDPEELSAFVNQLGFSKFSSIGQLPSPKDKKLPIKTDIPLKLPKLNERKTKNNHIKFDADEKQVVEVQKKNKQNGPQAKLENKKQNRNKNKIPGSSNTSNAATHKLIVKLGGGKWFEKSDDGKDTPEIENESSKVVVTLRQEEISQIQKNANNLLDNDVHAYKSSNFTGSNKSDYQWMDKMMKTGTLPDRMAAFIVRIQDSPVHNLHYLQQLISMVKVQGKQQCMMTADTVRDLFLEDLLLPGTKLIAFASRGVQLRTASKEQLIKWTFEDRLKVLYSSYVDALRRMASDTVEKLRGKGISIVYQLLVNHPEQEEVLLQVLVNKLGDPAKKMASRALFYLKQLLDEHPRMKRVVVEEVERLLFRNNISKRAQYYGICFLNLVNLKDEHASLAHKLITVYVAFFKSSVKTGDIDTKMMSGLLTGINRAFPQAKEFGFQFSENLDTLYKIVQFSQFAISIQALSILFQIVDVAGNPAGADRFYRVLYEKINAPEFKTSSHNGQLLNLIFKALKADVNINRVSGFTKRLLQVCQNSSANLNCAVLLVLSEVAKVHPQCLRIGNLSEKELESTNNREKLLKTEESSDSDNEEEKSSSLANTLALEKLMRSSNIKISDDADDSSSQPDISDIQKEVKLTQVTPMEMLKNSFQSKNETPIVVEIEDGNQEVKVEDNKDSLRRILTEYDPYARNPAYSGAELSLSYELISLSKHFHPSVALFAQTLIQKKSIKYDGNPFRDFTLTRFLERFSYRNAKPSKHHQEYQPKGLRNVPVNSDNYLSTTEEQIPIEEKFFYRFFKTKTEKKKSEIPEEDTSDTESIGDDEFDDLMKNYFKTGKEAESDEDEDESSPVDFASGLNAKPVGKNKKRKHEEDSESEDDEEDEGSAASDEDDDADDFISMEDGDDDEDLEDIDFGDEGGMFEDDDETVSFITKRKSKKPQKGDDMFAPAEEFAEMLEENADEIMTGSQTLINRDRADKKQLKWEVDKDRWMKGYSGGKRGGAKNSRKKFKK